MHSRAELALYLTITCGYNYCELEIFQIWWVLV